MSPQKRVWWGTGLGLERIHIRTKGSWNKNNISDIRISLPPLSSFLKNSFIKALHSHTRKLRNIKKYKKQTAFIVPPQSIHANALFEFIPRLYFIYFNGLFLFLYLFLDNWITRLNAHFYYFLTERLLVFLCCLIFFINAVLIYMLFHLFTLLCISISKITVLDIRISNIYLL